MVKQPHLTFEEYLTTRPTAHQAALKQVRTVILSNLPAGYVESFNGSMLTYEIPLAHYPITYNKQPLMLAALASQKNYMSLYLMAVYGDKETEQWFKQQFTASGKKLEMGKSCVHFKKLEDLPLAVIANTIARVPVDEYIALYEKTRKKK